MRQNIYLALLRFKLNTYNIIHNTYIHTHACINLVLKIVLQESRQSQELFDPVVSQERAEPLLQLADTATTPAMSQAQGEKKYADDGRYS